MNQTRRLALLIGGTLMLGACSKESAPTAAKDPGPDNAFTRYGENLARSEQRAQDASNKANAAIAKEQNQMNQMQQEQQGNNP